MLQHTSPYHYQKGGQATTPAAESLIAKRAQNMIKGITNSLTPLGHIPGLARRANQPPDP